MDDLSHLLNNSLFGCNLNNVYFNHFFYADDSCLLATSPSALQKLIDICAKYATEHDITYNELKYHCMLFKPKYLKTLNSPFVYLHGKVLEFISNIKYLGVYISDNLSDKTDMERHKKFIYIKGNYILSHFKKCSVDVKCKLFDTFCKNIYGGHMWVNYTKSNLNSVKVSFNNIYRFLFKVNRGESISQAMLYSNTDNFTVILRKQAGSFRKRLASSTNTLISTIFNSVFFMFHSAMSSLWRVLLF